MKKQYNAPSVSTIALESGELLKDVISGVEDTAGLATHPKEASDDEPGSVVTDDNWVF